MEAMPTLEAVVVPDNLATPQRSTFRVYPTPDWTQFCTNQGMDHRRDGVYIPRSLSAHLHSNTAFIQLYFFHEFYGHGSFCEYSSIGKKIVAYEHELAEIEKAVLGVTELPENTRFRVTSDHILFADYKTLRDELQQYFAANHDVYEGFALWFEKQLALRNGLGELHKARMELVDSPHRAILTDIEYFVKSNGVAALLEKLDFDQDVIP